MPQESRANGSADLTHKIARLVEERGWNQDEFARQAQLNRQTARHILLQTSERSWLETGPQTQEAITFDDKAGDKPGPLTPEEWELVRLHPFFTQCVLERIRGFGSLAVVAASHHERLDGRGYHRNLRGEMIPRGSVLVEGTTVRGLGRDVSVPPDAVIRRYDGAVIVPGFIDLATGLGLGGPVNSQVSLQTRLGECHASSRWGGRCSRPASSGRRGEPCGCRRRRAP